MLYTDGSKHNNGATCSEWFCTNGGTTQTTLFQSSCCIEQTWEIDGAEIHAIQEGVHQLVLRSTTNAHIIICADNTNTLQSLAGGRTNRREYVKKCLEDVTTLHLMGCTVRGKWSSSHSGIPCNEKADRLANQGALDTIRCTWTRSTFTWLRNAPGNYMSTQWREIISKVGHQPPPTSAPPSHPRKEPPTVQLAP